MHPRATVISLIGFVQGTRYSWNTTAARGQITVTDADIVDSYYEAQCDIMQGICSLFHLPNTGISDADYTVWIMS
jgi:hypothetical protein